MRRLGRLLAIALAMIALVIAGGLGIGGWDFLRQHVGALARCAAALVVVGALVWRLGGVLVRAAALTLWRRRTMSESGAAAAEFVIVIIPFLLLLFGVMQLALASLARLLVSYSAFCAARAAVVFVPASSDELGGTAPSGAAREAKNQVGAGGDQRTDFAGSAKTTLLRNAAAYALIPASPSIDIVAEDIGRGWPAYLAERIAHGYPGPALPPPLGALAGAVAAPGAPDGYAVDRALDAGFGASSDGPGGALLRSLRKLIYARLATVVTLHDPKNGAYKSSFAWGDPIQARVTYLFYCQIPLANRFAGHRFYELPDTVLQDLSTGPLGAVTSFGLPGYFMALTAEHTLINQGTP
jgi:hypothetical protein